MTMPRRDSGWVVLPDAAAVRGLADRFPATGRIVLPHASGNPWLVGRFAPDELVPVALGAVRVALVGRCPVDANGLAELVRHLRSVSDVDGLAHRLPGGVHLLVSVDGDVRVQGGISGLRQVFHAARGGVPIAGDRADLLAELVGAGIDDRTLAARVTCGALPAPLAGRSAWTGVRAVPPDCYLRMDAGGAREVRWWRAPEPEVPLRRGARVLRERLDAALSAPAPGRTGTELTGGMESTALCHLAARDNPDLLALRTQNDDHDAPGTAESARELGSVEQLVLPDRELPPFFASPAGCADPEQPCGGVRSTARVRHSAEVLAEHGVHRHFAADGGAELFGGGAGHLHALLRQRPITALRRLQRYRAVQHWPVVPTLSGLFGAAGVGRWWHEQADLLTAPPPDPHLPPLDWGTAPLRAAPWATSEALAATRALLHRTAREAEPLAAERGNHQVLAALRTAAPAHRHLDRLHAESGVRLELPFHDDRVVEAVLAVRPHERTDPRPGSPLLAEAVRDVVAPSVLGRARAPRPPQQDLLVGFRRNRAEILRLLSDSELAQHGLIDTGVLRAHLLGRDPDPRTLRDLEHLLACESWLRGATGPAPTTSSTGRKDAPATAS